MKEQNEKTKGVREPEPHDARDAMDYAAALVPGDLAELLSLLEGYRSALETIDTKLLNNGRNDERFPKARRMVEKWILRLREGPLPAPGNAAAMRAALKEQLRYWNSHIRTRDEEEMRKRTEAALAAPARNCDRPIDEAIHAHDDYCAAHDCANCPYYRDRSRRDCGWAWLFAPAKGGAE